MLGEEQGKYLASLIKRYPQMECAKESIKAAYYILEECYEKGGKLLVAGNGGSAADAEHIVGELMKGWGPTILAVLFREY